MNPITPIIPLKKPGIATGNKGYHFPYSNVAGHLSQLIHYQLVCFANSLLSAIVVFIFLSKTATKVIKKRRGFMESEQLLHLYDETGYLNPVTQSN